MTPASSTSGPAGSCTTACTSKNSPGARHSRPTSSTRPMQQQQPRHRPRRLPPRRLPLLTGTRMVLPPPGPLVRRVRRQVRVRVVEPEEEQEARRRRRRRGLTSTATGTGRTARWCSRRRSAI
jgi:hypothetical protein